MDPIEADADTDVRPTSDPSDNTTLSSVLTGLGAMGFAANVSVVDGARLRCGQCAEVSPAGAFAVSSIRRLEGASEPDEMVSVVAVVCPRCGACGVVVLGYGPSASPDDADVSVALRQPDQPTG